MTKQEIKFKDLNIWLKLGVIGGVIYLITFGISFLVGFVSGVLSV